MINQVKIALPQNEFSALVEIALEELRNPAEQARFILRQEFERRGFLEIKTPPVDQVTDKGVKIEHQ